VLGPGPGSQASDPSDLADDTADTEVTGMQDRAIKIGLRWLRLTDQVLLSDLFGELKKEMAETSALKRKLGTLTPQPPGLQTLNPPTTNPKPPYPQPAGIMTPNPQLHRLSALHRESGTLAPQAPGAQSPNLNLHGPFTPEPQPHRLQLLEPQLQDSKALALGEAESPRDKGDWL